MIKHQEYYKALQRLINNEPSVVKKGSKINKRNVALEAGKKNASSIRKGRDFDDLIAAIDAASAKAKPPRKARVDKADTLAIRNRELQDMLDISHAKYLAAMNLLLENGLYSVEQPSAQVIDLNEKDNAVRPTFDDPMTKDM
ncbi:MAG: hypothetical protein COB09_05785 [Thalassobium sp.]|jgi:hypothetical protein|uniref:Uncharacterized protein n=1 Tax=Thalassolituus oleivorans MIL-1 TaxID=1298593 RepID=M5DW17_9GAMM|nr:hypothetical protein [Thalassolituus oleivorans]MAK89742.1 hypothetical protein [Thalassolituus sp.]PHS65275.1 MAG: hypothetical protein COB09_05785 [Thalassobium sp.]AHK16891.1 hypothetical protein R615_15870 [Thalassolituus oleivorans R6-15]APR68450.1 hypothetical protein CN03_16800 [Thalassolituus oleivorans]CCU73775.1 hypothetical protein TOL_3385 [Thalassolituus oleivorans MIL-1]|tara:strand:+ start:604 stop:1029 length:426 start_codon:yes stop_codon:yes gene_type:complete